jgi:hypothetical protein
METEVDDVLGVLDSEEPTVRIALHDPSVVLFITARAVDMTIIPVQKERIRDVINQARNRVMECRPVPLDTPVYKLGANGITVDKKARRVDGYINDWEGFFQKNVRDLVVVNDMYYINPSRALGIIFADCLVPVNQFEALLESHGRIWKFEENRVKGRLFSTTTEENIIGANTRKQVYGFDLSGKAHCNTGSDRVVYDLVSVQNTAALGIKLSKKYKTKSKRKSTKRMY